MTLAHCANRTPATPAISCWSFAIRKFISYCSLVICLAACASAPLPPRSTLAPTPRRAASATPGRPARPTLLPSLTPPRLQNRTPDPTPTPAPVLRQLASGGCCVNPFWSPDGSQVWFVDKPSDVQPSGIWGVPAAPGIGGGEPVFITDRLGLFSRDGLLVAYPEAGETIVERRADGGRWRTPAGGRAVSFSPDSAWIAWQTASSTVNFDRRIVEIWIARVDGTEARSVARLIGGGLAGWFPDSARLLVTGRESLESDPALAVVDVATGAVTGLARADYLRGAVISPGGGWIAYQVAFSGDLEQDGLWVLPVGGEARRLRLFGAYQWRAEGRLLVVPLEATGGSQRLVEVEAATGELSALTDPRITPFRIAAGDWAVAPDGSRLVFVNAQDRNLWLLELPPTVS